MQVAEQTTTQKDEELNNLRHLCKAQKTRIAFLEMTLKQRHEKTVNYYRRIKPFLKSQRDKIHKVFLELPPAMRLNYKDFNEEFLKRYPDANTKNNPRRMREMVTGLPNEKPRLFCHNEEDGTVTFSLLLKD